MLKTEEGVFLNFPNATREILAQQICNCLLSGLTSPSVLNTNVHATIIMECIGQCFSLPLPSSKIIEGGINLYSKWILEESSKPPPLKEDEQYFLKEICKQLSLVFVKREYQGVDVIPHFNTFVSKASPSTRQSDIQMSSSRTHSPSSPPPPTSQDWIGIHVTLCNRVLELYRAIGTSHLLLIKDTWDSLLKIIMGISDYLLTPPPGLSPLSDRLESNIINVRSSSSSSSPPSLFSLFFHFL